MAIASRLFAMRWRKKARNSQSLRRRSVAFDLKSGKHLAADMALSGAPSVFFDAVAIFASAEGIKPLLKNSAAIDWVRDAFGHLKVIGHTAAAQPLFAKAGIADDLDEGVIELDARASVGQYIEAAKQQRVWDREARLSESDA